MDDGLTKSERYRLKDIEAYRKRKREYARTPEERAKRTEYMRGWRERNRERHNELARESHHRRKNDPGVAEKTRARYMARKYGLTPDDYDRMLAEQEGGCAICGAPPKTRRLHIDHDHNDGRVRGLLCTRCNTALGWFELHGETAHAYAGLVW